MTKRDDIGNRIAKARLQLGANRGQFVSQADLAAMVGLTGATVGNYEAGRTEPSYAILAAIAKVLGVDAGWLAFGDAPDPKKHVHFPPEPRSKPFRVRPEEEKKKRG